MKEFLSQYIDSSREKLLPSKYPGPVIMISRECGCSAKRIATKLSKILTGYSFLSDTKTDVEWKWVSKEIIEAAAIELEMEPEKVKSVFLTEAKISIQDVTTAFSTDKIYDSEDQEIIDTVRKIIHRLAEQGNYIIVGRAAGMIAQDVSRKLSIKLQAPLDWRINRIMQISTLSHADAQEYVLEIDRQRELFIEHVAGRKPNNNDYDIIFNYSTMNDDYIVEAIVNVLKSKRFLAEEDDQ